jgi:hypothetical protein
MSSLLKWRFVTDSEQNFVGVAPGPSDPWPTAIFVSASAIFTCVESVVRIRVYQRRIVVFSGSRHIFFVKERVATIGLNICLQDLVLSNKVESSDPRRCHIRKFKISQFQ